MEQNKKKNLQTIQIFNYGEFAIFNLKILIIINDYNK